MSGVDAEAPLRGYFAESLQPVECGGPRRQKVSRGPGLAVGAGEALHATPRFTGRWNVMFIWRGAEELYLYGTCGPGDPSPSAWVERVDPLTLEPLARSPDLPTGGHVWCGGLIAHEDGDLYVVSGNGLHRLSADLRLMASCTLPVDGAFNGLMALSDGILVTKDLRLDGAGSSVVLVEPGSLRVRQTLELPEPSMGRLAIEPGADGDAVYVPGTEHIFRLLYREGGLILDPSWRPRYRTADDERQGPCWDVTLGLGSAWVQDNGDVHFVRRMLTAHPVGSQAFTPEMGGPRTGAVRLLRFGLKDAGDADVVGPFGEEPGWNVAPAVVVPQHGVVVAYDTGAGRVAAFHYEAPGRFAPLWTAAIANWWQPQVHADSCEIVLDDYRVDEADDNIVVLDLLTGLEKGRVRTGCPVPSGMLPCPGTARDLYYSSNLAVARVFVGT